MLSCAILTIGSFDCSACVFAPDIGPWRIVIESSIHFPPAESDFRGELHNFLSDLLPKESLSFTTCVPEISSKIAYTLVVQLNQSGTKHIN